MALQGTLSDFGLDEVLRLLEAGKKQGRLRVTGGPGESTGNLWVDGGRIVGSALGPAASGGDHVESVFQLLRLEIGEFNFHAEESVTESADPESIGDVLAAATTRLAEWRELSKVLPSLDHWLSLTDSIPTAVTVEPAQWSVLAQVGSGLQISTCVDQVGLGLVPSCRLIVELVDRSLVSVTEEMPARAAAVVGSGQIEPQLPSVGAVDKDAEAAEAAEATRAEVEPEPKAEVEPTPAEPEPKAEVEPEPTPAEPEPAAGKPADAVAEDSDVNPRALLRLLNSVK